MPGFNVVGIVGFLILLFGVGYAYNDMGTLGGSLFAAGTLAVTGSMFLFLWRSGAWDRFILATNLRKDETLIARESADRARYLGELGTAVTPLRPTGIVEIDGARIEVMTEGEFIAAGSVVSVVAMDRRRYFVRLATPDEQLSISNSSDS